MTDEVAVIFTSRRTEEDAEGYAAAAQAMEALARAQPGFVSLESARATDGFGITVSLWSSEAHAVAWRRHAEHSIIREAGRAHRYEGYAVTVARVTRTYAWERAVNQDAPSVR